MGNMNLEGKKHEARAIIENEIGSAVLDLTASKDIGSNNEGIEYLVSQPTGHIIKLLLCKNSISASGVELLAKGCWTNLKTLNLWNNRIGNKGCKYLTKGDLKCLCELNLAKNEIETAGVMHLSKGKWRLLNVLNLFNNRIGENGVKQIVRMEYISYQRITLNKNMMMGFEVFLFLLTESNSIKWLQASANRMSNSQASFFTALSAGIINKVQINNDNFT